MKEVGLTCIVVYVLLTVLMIIPGALEADRRSCSTGFDRPLKYVFPTYQLGCWLNTPWRNNDTD